MTTTHGTADTAAPNRWWSDRWAWRGAIAAAPLGALLAIVYALLVLRLAPTEALLAYLLGAGVASGIGCVLAGPLGASIETLRYRRDSSLDDDVHLDEDVAYHSDDLDAPEQDSPAVDAQGEHRTYAGAA